MNTTPTEPEASRLIVALEFDEVQLADTIPITELFRPKNNFIATPVLARLLDAILESAGQLVSTTLGAGPLNHSFFVCSVRDANTAAKTLWPLLRELRLAGGAKLYRTDKSEGVYRCVFPAAGDVVSFDELLKRFFTAASLTSAGKARAEELQRLVDMLNPTNQSGGDAKQ